MKRVHPICTWRRDHSPFCESAVKWSGSNIRRSRMTISNRCFMRSRPNTKRSEEHTSELQSQSNLVCRLLLEKNKKSRVLLLSAGTQVLNHKMMSRPPHHSLPPHLRDPRPYHRPVDEDTRPQPPSSLPD